MRRREREDDAVSAAIATVLLFAGVLAIISGMMASVTPLIAEKHGSIERQAMAGQMTDLATETVRISETGVPGDSATVPLRPHSGDLGWDLAKGGTWYSLTYKDGDSLRLDDVLDLDSSARLRFPSSEVSAICYSDLRASTSATWNYRLPDLGGTVAFAAASGLQKHLEPIVVEIVSGNTSTSVTLEDTSGVAMEVDAGTWLQATAEMNVLFDRGQGGLSTVTADLQNPRDGTGRTWTIPLPSNDVSVSLVSDNPGSVEWSLGSQSGSGVATGSPATWSGSWQGSAGEVLSIRTDSPSRVLLLSGNEEGATTWPATDSAGIGTSFTLPDIPSDILIDNPGDETASVKIRGLFHSVPANGHLRLDWDLGAGEVTSTKPVSIKILTGTGTDTYRPSSLEYIPAFDSGRESGTEFKFSTPTTDSNLTLLAIPASPESSMTFYSSLSGNQSATANIDSSDHAVSRELTSGASGFGRVMVNTTDLIDDGAFRIIASAGDGGLLEVKEDGAERCVPIDLRASGWIEHSFPWVDLTLSSDSGVIQAWNEGSHPLGVSIRVIGESDESPFSTIGSAWAVHLPRLNYEFRSSVSGMEIGYRGGFVGTNHPEFHPEVLVSPPAREGPGPRLAVTIPLTMPDLSSSIGNAAVDMSVTLDHRDQLVSVKASEIRRGWDGPYGAEIAAEASSELAFSADWLAFPGQIDMLDDYVGWVQLTAASGEAIYHAAGEDALFNLQLSQLNIEVEVLD